MDIQGTFFSGILARAFAVLSIGLVSTMALAQPAPTVQVLKDVAPGINTRLGIDFNGMFNGDGVLYMNTSGSTPNYGYELHRLNSATGKVERLNDLWPGSNSAYPNNFHMHDGKLYFIAYEPTAGNELRVYDPADGSTKLALDLSPGPGYGTNYYHLESFAGKIYIVAISEFDSSQTLYSFDPEQPDNADISVQSFSSSVMQLFVWHDKLWVLLNTPIDGSLLHSMEQGQNSFTPLTMTGNVSLSGTRAQSPHIATANDYLIFSSYNTTNGNEAMVVNLTTGEFTQYDFRAGINGYVYDRFISHEGTFYFSTQTHSIGTSLLALDPVSGQSTVVVPSSEIYFQANLALAGDKILFRGAPAGSDDHELYQVDTSDNSYRLVADLWPGEEGSFPQQFTQVGSLMYFIARPRIGGYQLFTYNIDTGAVTELSGVVEVAASSWPERVSTQGDWVAFTGYPNGGGYISADPQQQLLQQQQQLQQLQQQQQQQEFQPPQPPEPFPQVQQYETTSGTQIVENIDGMQVFLLNARTGNLQQVSTLSHTIDDNYYISGTAVLGDYMFYALRGNQSQTIDIMRLNITTGELVSAWSNPAASASEMYIVGDRAFVNIYTNETQWVPYQLRSDGSVENLNELTTGVNLSYAHNASRLGDVVYFSAYDSTQLKYWAFKYDISTGVIEEAITADDFGGVSSSSYLNNVILGVGADHIYLWVQNPVNSTPGIYTIDRQGQVSLLPNSETWSAYRGAELGNYFVFHGYSNSIFVYDLQQNSIQTIDAVNGEGFGIAYPEITVVDGRFVFSGYMVEYGYSELFEVIPETATINLLAELNAGPLDSRLFIHGSAADKLILTGYNDAVGAELFTLVFNQAPTISGTPTTSVAEGQPYSFIPTASDAEQDDFSFSITGKPSWASFSTVTGALTGTPGFTDAGLYSNIVISVSDATGSSSLPAFSINVINTNRAPVISGTPPSEVNEGELYSFTPTASDADNDDLTFDVFNLPNWASFDDQTGTLSGTPNFDQAGNYSDIRIVVSDATDTAQIGPFMISVLNVNRPPTISGTPQLVVDEGQLYSFQASAVDPDNNHLVFLISNNPTWMSINADTGLVSGTPGFSDAGTYNNIVVSVTDGPSSDALPAFSVTVNNVNRAPTISGTPSLTVNEGVAYSFVPTAADADNDQLSFEITGKPSWASFNTGTGALTGTPSFTDAGTYPGITISVFDSTDRASLPAFTITVNNVNRAPVISGTPASEVLQDAAYSFVPTVTDEDEGDTLSFSVSGAPTWMSLNGSTGALTGTPTNADVGVTSNITLTVTDGSNDSDSLSFSVTVLNVNDAPVISGTPAAEVAQDAAYSFTPTVEDPDANDTLSFSVRGEPSWMSLNGSTGALTGTPRNADVGVTSNIVLTVIDSGGLSDSLSFSVTVTNVNDAPEITNSPLLTLKDGEAYSFVPEVTDPDTEVDPEESFSFTIANQPTWAEFDSTTGALTGTPTKDDIGEWTNISITVTDRDGLSDSVGPFTITVSASNRPPVAVDDYFEFDSGADLLVLDVLANDSDPDDDSFYKPRIVGVKQLTGMDQFYVSNGGNGINLMMRDYGSKYIGTILIEYTISDDQGERDSALVTVVFLDPNPTVTLTPPADITVNAQGVLTQVSTIGSATAVDSNGRPVPVSVTGVRDGYITGIHTVTWSAGEGAQRVSKPQQITVNPSVSLDRNLEVTADTAFDIPVRLSGMAPSYPLVVDLMVGNDNQQVTFTEGTTVASYRHPGLDFDSSIQVSLDASVHRGQVSQITVTVEAQPKPTQRPGRTRNPTPLPGDEISITSPTDTSGLNFVTANSVTATLVPASGSPEIPALVTIISATEITVAVPSDAPPGVYLVTVLMTLPDYPSLEVIVPVVVRRARGIVAADDSLLAFEYNPNDEDLSRELDQNDNGFVDYEDGRWDDNANGIPAYLDRAITNHQIWADGAFAESRPGTYLMGYPREDDARSIRVASTPSPVDQLQGLHGLGFSAFTHASVDAADYRFFGEFYRFKVNVLETWGANAEVVLPLDEPLAAGSEFLLWQTGAWRTFEEGAEGSLASAGAVYGVCPSVESAAWQPGLNEGHWCVRLVIKDGGVNDTDGAENASVDVFGGAAIHAAGNAAPVAVADTATAVWRGSVSIPVLANDTDADGDSLSVVSASVDIGTVTVNAARNAVHFVSPGDFAGVAVITYVVTDNNGGVAVGTATVTVLENRAPVLGADSAVTTSGRPVTVNVLANDADPDGDTLLLVSAQLSSGSGTVSFVGGSVTFTPSASFVGVATVSYGVSDGRGGNATGTLTVQVRAPVEVIEVRPASGSFWWFLGLGGLLLALRRRR